MLTSTGMGRRWSITRCTSTSSPVRSRWWLDLSKQKHRKYEQSAKAVDSHLHRYYQPKPNAANGPYPRNPALKDPDYSSCLGGNCDALALRILNSKNTTIYGAGLYSFFNHYNTTCSDSGGSEDCQSEIFSVEGNSGLSVYTLSTIGTTHMIVRKGKSLARYSDNLATFAQTIAYFKA